MRPRKREGKKEVSCEQCKNKEAYEDNSNIAWNGEWICCKCKKKPYLQIITSKRICEDYEEQD